MATPEEKIIIFEGVIEILKGIELKSSKTIPEMAKTIKKLKARHFINHTTHDKIRISKRLINIDKDEGISKYLEILEENLKEEKAWKRAIRKLNKLDGKLLKSALDERMQLEVYESPSHDENTTRRLVIMTCHLRKMESEFDLNTIILSLMDAVKGFYCDWQHSVVTKITNYDKASLKYLMNIGVLTNEGGIKTTEMGDVLAKEILKTETKETIDLIKEYVEFFDGMTREEKSAYMHCLHPYELPTHYSAFMDRKACILSLVEKEKLTRSRANELINGRLL